MHISTEKIKSAEQILIDNGIEDDKAGIILRALGFALLDEDFYENAYAAKNIKWNKTDSKGNPIDVYLPNDVIVTFEDLQKCERLEDNATDEDIEEALSDYLTDTYDFYHYGFDFEKIPSM